MNSKFYDPTDSDYQRLAKQWLFVVDLVNSEYNLDFEQNIESLELIQRIVDDEILTPEMTYELQCLGVALGRIVAKTIADLDWYIVEDEYGRDPTLRYLQTSFHFNPLTMISKRVEEGSKVDVKSLYDWICEKLNVLKGNIEHC